MRDYKIVRSYGTGLLYSRRLGLFCKDGLSPSQNNPYLNDIERMLNKEEDKSKQSDK